MKDLTTTRGRKEHSKGIQPSGTLTRDDISVIVKAMLNAFTIVRSTTDQWTIATEIIKKL